MGIWLVKVITDRIVIVEMEDMKIIIAFQVHIHDMSYVTEQVKQSVLHSYPEP